MFLEKRVTKKSWERYKRLWDRLLQVSPIYLAWTNLVGPHASRSAFHLLTIHSTFLLSPILAWLSSFRCFWCVSVHWHRCSSSIHLDRKRSKTYCKSTNGEIAFLRYQGKFKSTVWLIYFTDILDLIYILLIFFCFGRSDSQGWHTRIIQEWRMGWTVEESLSLRSCSEFSIHNVICVYYCVCQLVRSFNPSFRMWLVVAVRIAISRILPVLQRLNSSIIWVL